ncbi:MAG: malate dehydrogenase, partial [Dehalococcoidia bacterium]
ELGVSAADVHAYVLGGHTEATMVPVVSNAMVGGLPLTSLLSEERIQALVERTRQGGAEVVALLKTGSAFSAPAAATAEMVEAVLLDRKRILPCCAYLQGEYGIEDAFVGVPLKLGAGGIEAVLEGPLAPEELEGMRRAAEATKELVNLLRAQGV